MGRLTKKDGTRIAYKDWGDGDKNIPPTALRWMAERADGREIIEVEGASHALTISQTDAVAGAILRAANAA